MSDRGEDFEYYGEFGEGFQSPTEIVEDVLSPYVVNPSILALAHSFMVMKRADPTSRRTGIRWGFPVVSVPVFRDTRLNVTIFLLEPGAKLDLHGHPNAVGMIKTAIGSVRLQAFTLLNQEESDIVKKYKCVNKKAILFEQLKAIILNDKSDPWAFTSEIGNAHEITCGPSPAAVLEAHMVLKDDLLSESEATTGWSFLNHIPVQVPCMQLAPKYITILHEVVRTPEIHLLVPYTMVPPTV